VFAAAALRADMPTSVCGRRPAGGRADDPRGPPL